MEFEIGNSYFGLEIGDSFFSLALFPFGFEIMIFEGMEISIIILNAEISFKLQTNRTMFH